MFKLYNKKKRTNLNVSSYQQQLIQQLDVLNRQKIKNVSDFYMISNKINYIFSEIILDDLLDLYN